MLFSVWQYQSIPAMKYDPTSDSIEEVRSYSKNYVLAPATHDERVVFFLLQGSLAEKMMAYDIEPEDRTEVTQSLNEFTTAVAMQSGTKVYVSCGSLLPADM